MDSQKIYLLAELTVPPEFLDDVKGALKQKRLPLKTSLTPVWREIQSSALWSSIITVSGCGVV